MLWIHGYEWVSGYFYAYAYDYSMPIAELIFFRGAQI